MSNVSVSMKLTPKQAGALYMKNIELEKENEQLLAQVELLRKTIIDATNNGAVLDSGKWIYSIDDSVINILPQQALTELKREIAAMAVEKAINSTLLTYGDTDLTADEIKRLSAAYANKIKSGEVDI